ncbi:universal stress protein [Halorubrum gandharaense]
MYDRILYPTDGSGGAKAAIDHVQALASAFDATVHVLYAVDDRPVEFGLVATGATDATPGMGDGHHADEQAAMGDPRSDTPDEKREVVERAEAAVAEVAAEFEGVDVETLVHPGTPYEVIRHYADDIDADMIVMGTHGRTGVDRMLIGSVTEKVVRTADVPVVTVSRNGEISES